MLHDLEKFYTKIHCEKKKTALLVLFLKIYLALAMQKLRLSGCLEYVFFFWLLDLG